MHVGMISRKCTSHVIDLKSTLCKDVICTGLSNNSQEDEQGNVIVDNDSDDEDGAHQIKKKPKIFQSRYESILKCDILFAVLKLV